MPVACPAPLNSQPANSQPAGVAVMSCHLGDDRDIALAGAWALLSAQETLRARRFHFDRDRQRYVRARAFLRREVGQATGQSAAGLILAEGPQGKPFLPGSDLCFNLSHSSDLAVLALSWSGPLGIDLEFIDRKADIDGLAQTCLTVEEAAVLAALPAAARPQRFFAFWTAKEARMKLTGEGMTLPPRQIALTLVAGLPVGYHTPDTPAAQALFVDMGHSGAICCLAVAQGPHPIITPRHEAFCHVAQ